MTKRLQHHVNFQGLWTFFFLKIIIVQQLPFSLHHGSTLYSAQQNGDKNKLIQFDFYCKIGKKERRTREKSQEPSLFVF